MTDSYKAQGARAGSTYVAASFAVSGVLTYVFLGLPERFLTREEYGGLGLLWSTNFLVVQVLWIGVSQTLGRYVAEREARGEDARVVVSAVRRVQLGLLAAFLVVGVVASPLLTDALFGGNWLLTAALLAAVAAYAPEYFRRGTLSGHRQFSRLGALHVAESSSRALIGCLLVVVGAGVAGPALAIVLAPLIGVLAVRPGPVIHPERKGGSFAAAEAFRFTAPVIACVGFAQILMNGGTILVSLFGGPEATARAGVFFTALILARAPQYVLSPAIAALLPHASRALARDGEPGLDRFVLRAAGSMALVGAAMVAGTWLFGEWAMSLLFSKFQAGRGLLVSLAALAAFYLLSETLNQALFARGRARLAALGWALGLPASALCMAALGGDLLLRVAISLAVGAFVAASAQALFYLGSRSRIT
jgi:O-antigen/teichoic acid export membrane protein